MIHCSGASRRLAVPVASVGVMLRGKNRLASIGAADRPVAAFAGSPAGFTLMSLRPFVFLTACLLGACERKDASADATLPDHAETRSSLRDEERRPVVTRKEREGKVDAVDLIRRLAREVASPDGSYGDLLERAEEAIRQADPDEFDAIWKELSKMEPGIPMVMQVNAIYHLAAKEDVAVAGRIAREILFPLYEDGDRRSILEELLRHGQDGEKLASFLEFMRDFTPEERQWLKEEVHESWISLDQLSNLAGSDQRLSSDETEMIVKAFVIPDIREFAQVAPTEPEVKANCRTIWETVKAGERNGVFAKGAGDMYLNVAGIFQGDWYLEVVPLERLDSMLRMEGGAQVVEGLIGKDIGRTFLKGEHVTKDGVLDMEGLANGVPETFFTPTGIRYLPEERYVDAIMAWHFYRNEKAEAWFANASELTPHQRDLIRAGLAKSEGRWSKEEKSRSWLDQISDPELRERTVKEIEEAK